MTKEEMRRRPKDFSKTKADGICLDGIELLLAFHSMKSEVDISPITEDAKAKNIKVVYSGTDPYRFEDVALSDIDCPAIMLVPGLAFTVDGKRLGRGGGFYDRAIAVLPPCVKTIGVCKKSQIVDDIPMEKHDMKVGKVLGY